MIWVNAVLQGVLLGGVYALSAAGLALAFGIMRLINMAHGDVLVLAAFTAAGVMAALSIGPIASLIVVVPAMAALGYGLQRLLLNRTLGADPLPGLLVTFGLSIVLQNMLLSFFTADSRRLNAGWLETASVSLGPQIQIGLLPLLMFASAVLGMLALQWIFYSTPIGRAFRASADDPEIARLMGLKTDRVYAIAIALAFAFVALAGIFLAIRTNFDPSIGPSRLIVAFEVVVIGGLGRLHGALVGGILLGVAHTLGAQINPAWQLLTGHLVFLSVLVLRPTGLFSGNAA